MQTGLLHAGLQPHVMSRYYAAKYRSVEKKQVPVAAHSKISTLIVTSDMGEEQQEKHHEQEVRYMASFEPLMPLLCSEP